MAFAVDCSKPETVASRDLAAFATHPVATGKVKELT